MHGMGVPITSHFNSINMKAKSSRKHGANLKAGDDAGMAVGDVLAELGDLG